MLQQKLLKKKTKTKTTRIIKVQWTLKQSELKLNFKWLWTYIGVYNFLYAQQ